MRRSTNRKNAAHHQRHEKRITHLLHSRSPGHSFESLEDRRMLSITPPYTPAQVLKAYGVDQIQFLNNIKGDGKGQTIAIIDPGDDSKFVNTGAAGFNTSDLHTFDQNFNLKDPPSFKVVGTNGKSGSRPQYGGNIIDASESGTKITIKMDSATNFFAGETVSLTGFADARYNLNALKITSVSADTKTFTFTEPNGTMNLPHLAGTALGKILNPVSSLDGRRHR